MSKPLAVVVCAHPNEDSYTRVLFDAAVRGLEHRYEVMAIDLYGLGFDPVMSEAEWRAYIDREPTFDAMQEVHAEAVREAALLAFVYPTWWFGPPAILKGWLDKILAPGVAFVIDEDGKLQPELRSLRTVIGVSTYGSSRASTRILGDGGRRMLLRALRLNAPQTVRRKWFAHYRMDQSTPASRESFIDRVETGMGRL